MLLRCPHLMAKHCLKVGRKSRIFPDLRQETCPHVAVKVWQSGPRNHAGSVHQLCYTPRQCQSTTILASLHAADSATWWPNIAWKLAGNREFFLIWGKKPVPPCGCKSMTDGPRNHAGSVHQLCYTPRQCQSTTILASLHAAIGPTWWPNIAWKLAGNRNLETRNLPPCGCKRYDRVALEIMLGVFINFVIHPDNARSTTILASLHAADSATWWPNIAWKLAGNRNLGHETRQHVAEKVWWVDFQSCWKCSSTCYTPIHCQTTTIQQPTCCYTPTWWPNIAWKLAGNRDFFLIWGMKPANMWL